MSSSKITLFIDIVSPFAWEAYYILRNGPAFKDVHCTYVPILLGGLMKTCGNTPPINIKNKDKWINVERNRWARAFNVPMKEKAPPNFPPNTLHLMRALAALATRDDGQQLLVNVLDTMWPLLWAEHQDVHKPEVYEAIFREKLGQDVADQVLSEVSAKGKATLKENTDKAFEQGAFGLPWVVATNSRGQTEGFWGVDHMGQVLHFLGITKPEQGGWRHLL